MRFGLDVSQHQLSWGEQVRRTRFAEDLGFDGAWVFDHFKALYADPKGPCFEGWSLLAGLAAVTTRVRLGTLVTGMTYRHPSILATQAVTVDHISGGRLELAVGAAWFEQEHRELGIPFPPARERVERLGEGVQVLDLLMTRDDATFEGKYFRLDGRRTVLAPCNSRGSRSGSAARGRSGCSRSSLAGPMPGTRTGRSPHFAARARS
jgi:alkanesulfonate monooxygenase SsuD/methylene tetrahydromethanopterin reductase-like flavin-dependent oxidoreductase (luciferase family)